MCDTGGASLRFEGGARMFRFAACATLALGILAAGSLAAQQPVIRSTGEIVRVFVTATDRDGRLVTDLAQKDFEARDEGKPQPITVFDNSPKPIQLITLLDVSGSMYGNLPLLRAASEQLFRRLREDDVARLGTFGQQVEIGPEFTRDVDALLATLPREIDEHALTPLWRAVDNAMDLFKPDTDKRRLILVLSDGKDSGPTGFRQKIVSPAQIIDRAIAEDVMVYAVGMRSNDAQPRQIRPGLEGLREAATRDLPDPGLARVAEETGGGYTEIRYSQDLAREFARVADEIHSQYLLGYEPPKHDGKVHKIEVKVARSGVKPRARKSYVAPKGN
jgi:Ca-activated chloride channel family protein